MTHGSLDDAPGPGWLGAIFTSALRWPRLVLILFCLIVWLPGLASLPPGDRDESRFAQASKQMIETGDYVRIMNGDEPRNRKPIGIYWAQVPFAAAARALGIARDNPIWPYRLPSLLGALAAVLATETIGRRLFDARAGLLAGLMLASCLVLVAEVHIAKTDAALLGATTIAMAGLAAAWRAERPGWFGFWLAMGAGVLLKGPITPMVVGLAAASLCMVERRWRWLMLLRPERGVPLLLAVVLPWFVAIGIATHGAFLHDAVGGDLAAKLAGGDDAHGAPPGFHLLLLPITTFPACLLIIGAVPMVWRRRRDAAVRFLLFWLLPSWVVFEATPTKLPHYVLPLIPALCLLAAGVSGGDAVSARWWRVLSRAAFVVAGVGLACLSLGAPIWLGAAAWLGVPGAIAAGLIVGAGLAAGPVAAVLLMPAFSACLIGLELPALSPLWLAPRVVGALDTAGVDRKQAGARLGSLGFDEPSLRFLAGSRMRRFPDGQQAAAAMAAGEVKAVVVEGRRLDEFAQAASRAGVAVRAAGEVDGLDYSNGHHVRLVIEAAP